MIAIEKTECVICGSDAYSTEACGHDYAYMTSEERFCFVRCKECGHIYLNPRPAYDELKNIYPENYYTKSGRHKSIQISVGKRFVVRRRLAVFKHIFEGSGSILELGCGDCSLIQDVKRLYPKCSITGIDLSILPDTAQRCRLMGIEVLEGDAEKIDFGENSYDLIIMNQLIEHLRDPCKMLSKIFRALKPGGMINIETPNLDGYDRNFFGKSFWGGYYFPRHMHLFNTDSIEKLLGKHGFETVKHESLVAPIIWALSISAALCDSRMMPAFFKKWIRVFLSDGNPLILAVFTVVDLLALLIGLKTSNQKIVAIRPR